jgi:hypothetical protein
MYTHDYYICVHEWKDTYLVSASGKIIYWYTYRQWAHLTDDGYRQQLIHEHHAEIEDPIVEGGPCCRKCGACWTPRFIDLEN